MKRVSFPGYWTRSPTQVISHKLFETDEVWSSKETILLKRKGPTEPRRLFLSLTQGHWTSTVHKPNTTLKMGCKTPYCTSHPPPLKADIKYLCETIHRLSLPMCGCGAPRSQQADAQPPPFIQLRGQLWSHSQGSTPEHHSVFNNADCIMLLSQVAKSTFSRSIFEIQCPHVYRN